jgi:RHS repeat-associated protein
VAHHRLTQAIATGNSTYNLTYSYTADGSNGEYGNVTCDMLGSTQGLCPQYTFKQATNQISNSGFTYDAAGNLLSYITAGYTYNYQYDAEGRLVSLLRTDRGDFRYPMYNALGQRVRELRAATPTTSQTLDYPRGIFGYRAGVFNEGWGGWDIYDTRVAGQVMQLGSGLEYFLHTDAVGSTTMDTDNTGAVDRDITFYPWGQTWQVSGSNFWENFGGLGHQANGGFYPARQREYSPDLGRWPTPDPEGGHLENPQTLNKYVYAGDNPTSLNDPTGLDFYLSCQTSDHSGCTQVGISKSEVWVQADRNGKATVVTSDSIRAGENTASIYQNGVRINGNNKGIYFDNPASIHSGVDTNPIDLSGSDQLQGFQFHINGNCGGTCMASGTFTYEGTPTQTEQLLERRGGFQTIWDIPLPGIWQSVDEMVYHRNSTQYRFGVGPSPHFSVPAGPPNLLPTVGPFHVDTNVPNLKHGACAILGVDCY